MNLETQTRAYWLASNRLLRTSGKVEELMPLEGAYGVMVGISQQGSPNLRAAAQKCLDMLGPTPCDTEDDGFGMFV